MKFSTTPKRLVLFLFYDAQGIVDSYIPYMLKDIQKNANRIMVVSNGAMTKQSKDALAGIADEIFERENVGYDVWGYKEALEKIGFENLSEYDEIVLMNYTIMGPVYPFAEMFSEMETRDLDFWGITKFHRIPNDPFGKSDCGFLREHIQSHFIAIRREMFSSPAFRTYWENMPMINSYEDSIGYHESKFTHHFASLGYKWDIYVNTDAYEGICYGPIIFYPARLIKEQRCPIFKRRSFMHNYEDFHLTTAGEASYELMEYLKHHTDYDTDMIFENLLRCYDMELIKNCLHLNYVLPADASEKTKEHAVVQKKKIACVFHAYFPDLIEETRHYLWNLPESTDVYITTNTKEKKELFETQFADHPFHKLEVLLIENRGRDVSALLVATKDFLFDYDYVCFAHDKKVGQLAIGSIGVSFAYHCLENVLGSCGYVQNVIELFEENDRLGLLTPMPPIHSIYYSVLGNEWGPNFETTKELADKLGLRVPIHREHAPIAPLGTMFWFRPSALKPLFAKDWQYSDFPTEPIVTDGTILHAIERIYPYAAQEAGYYSAWGFIDRYASIVITNQSFTQSKFTPIFDKLDYGVTFMEIWSRVKGLPDTMRDRDEMHEILLSLLQEKIVRARLYFRNEEDFCQEHSVFCKAECVENRFECVFDLPENTDFRTLRFDPDEFGHLLLHDLCVTYCFEDGERTVTPSFQTNAFVHRKNYLFLEDDPQLIWNYTDKRPLKQVRISATINRHFSNQEAWSIVAKASNKPSLLRRTARRIKRILRK